MGSTGLRIRPDGKSVVAAVCRWDDQIYCKENYPQGQLLLGKICIGQYAQWAPAALKSGGHDPALPIKAWATQANFIDGKYNEEPAAWFATEADARRFVEGFAVELVNAVGRALHLA